MSEFEDEDQVAVEDTSSPPSDFTSDVGNNTGQSETDDSSVGVSTQIQPLPWLRSHERAAMSSEEIFRYNRERAIRVLTQEGYVRWDEEGRLVCDIKKFTNKSSFKHFKNRMGYIATRPEYGGGKWIPTLFEVFGSMPVYSEDDLKLMQLGEVVEPKPLLYIPQDADSALDIEEIRKSRFHLGAWEVGEVPVLPKTYPTVDEGKNSALSTHEAVIACLIYHPKFGNGERDSKGKLNVNFKNGDRNPLSHSFFKSWRYYGAPVPQEENTGRARSRTLPDSPVSFLRKYCPNLEKRGLVDPDSDFQVLHNKSELGQQVRVIGKQGTVFMAGRNHSVGREYASDNGFLAYQISDGLGAILASDDEGIRIIKIFRLNTAPLSDKEREVEAGSRYVNKEDIEFLNPEDFEEIGSTESLLVSDFEDFIEFSQRTAKEGEFDVLGLSLKEKSLVTSIFQRNKDNPRLWEFVGKYKLNGLRAMMAVEEAHLHAESVWEIGEKMDATKVFDDVSRIVEIVNKYREKIRVSLPEAARKQSDEVARTVMAFTSKLFLSLVPVVREAPEVRGKIDLGDVIHSIRQFKRKVEEMYSEEYGIHLQDKLYAQILELYKSSGSNPNIEAVALDLLRQEWSQESKETEVVERVLTANDAFYSGYAKLFQEASETTGDTDQELERFQEFLETREAEEKPVKGTVLDVGCGDGRRITKPMAMMLEGEARIIGMDRIEPDEVFQDLHPNMTFVKGDLSSIPLQKNSVNLVTAHWSVMNDLITRRQQMRGFSEVARVLKLGGEFYFDVPYLEGGEGGWEKAAQEYNTVYPHEPYGKIHGTVGDRSKEFHIYPEFELLSFLDYTGFSVVSEQVWRTKKGAPRKMLVARLNRRVIPS